MFKEIEKNTSAIIGSITTITLIVGAFLTVDGRYAHSDEVQKMKTEQQQVVRQNQYDLRQSANTIRKQLLEDKVFEIQLIPDHLKSQYDKARLQKYQSDLGELKRQLAEAPPSIIIEK